MEQALTNLPAYRAADGLTRAQLLAIGDINGDGVVNNADLQALINLLQSGGGSSATVPEPASVILLALAVAVMVASMRSQRRSGCFR